MPVIRDKTTDDVLAENAQLREALGQWVDIYEGRCDDNLTDGERRLEAWTASVKLLPSNAEQAQDRKP